MKNYRALLAAAALLLMSGLAAGRYFADVPGEGPALAFYWWKSVYDPLPEEQDMAAESGASRLYLRFFDVVGKGGWPVPAATVAFRQRPELPVIPVVFIDNEAVRDSGGEEAQLAGKIVGRVLAIGQGNNLDLPGELQIDCDWTESTRERYFALLREIKARLPQGWRLSVTLRLYAFRYPGKAGVPPADRATLMAYNMGELRRAGEHNSILSASVAKAYMSRDGAYPLPLDVALPLFSWGVLFNGETYVGLIRRVPEVLGPEGPPPPAWKRLGPNLFELREDAALEGRRLPRGLTLRVERTEPEELEALVRELRKGAPRPDNVLFYHLDAATVKPWRARQLRSLVDAFR